MLQGTVAMNTTAILTDREGRVVDSRFNLLRWLGGTAESSVYLTEADGEGANGDGAGQAAIKLVPAGNPGADARLAGWTAAARLDHPHLLRVLHTGRSALEQGLEPELEPGLKGGLETGPQGAPDDGEVVYAVTEFADEVLAEILPERALNPDETKEMLEPILDALACLHSHGFVHGRLKPSNILVVGENLNLSADCSPIASGKAAALAPSSRIYDAPELSRGLVSPAADVWSLGMTLVAALTQRTPAWDRESGFEPVVRPALPWPFESIVRDCLRLDPAGRLTLPEIKDRLEGKEPAANAPATHPDFDPDFTPTPAHSSRWLPAWIAAAAFLGITVTALVLHSRQSPASEPVTEPASAPAAEQPASAPTPTPTSAPATASSATAPFPARSQTASARPSVSEKPSAARPVQLAEPQPAADAGASANGAIVRRVMPDVLPDARATIRGKVLINVRVQVDASGAVSGAVSDSPRASRYFNRVAVEAAQQWQFAPAAPGAWELHFEFRPGGTTVTADPRSP
jgi:TonB family protein